MTEQARPRTVPRVLSVVASLLVVGGIIAIVAALRAQGGPPQPNASAAGVIAPIVTRPSTTTAPLVPQSAHATTTSIGVPESAPISLTIPSIGVQSTLVRLGLDSTGSVEVPTDFHVAGWYERSVTPGTTGPAIILGHVDSKSGPGIFFRLGQLRPGDHVAIARADGSHADFVITGVRSYAKAEFPTLAVYANTPVPTIRLITCGGAFDCAYWPLSLEHDRLRPAPRLLEHETRDDVRPDSGPATTAQALRGSCARMHRRRLARCVRNRYAAHGLDRTVDAPSTRAVLAGSPSPTTKMICARAVQDEMRATLGVSTTRPVVATWRNGRRVPLHISPRQLHVGGPPTRRQGRGRALFRHPRNAARTYAAPGRARPTCGGNRGRHGARPKGRRCSLRRPSRSATEIRKPERHASPTSPSASPRRSWAAGPSRDVRRAHEVRHQRSRARP